ncbi:MAG TPA: VOC family protein, partial [Acidimicrobiia bacterium]|nr:VOC family protein [Acidimicrobiia bacterium]
MGDGVEPVPESVPTLATRLVFGDATAAIAFYQEAFGATVREEPHKAPDGKVVHSEVWIGDSVVFLTDEG